MLNLSGTHPEVFGFRSQVQSLAAPQQGIPTNVRTHAILDAKKAAFASTTLGAFRSVNNGETRSAFYTNAGSFAAGTNIYHEPPLLALMNPFTLARSKMNAGRQRRNIRPVEPGLRV